jgi:hypothetical protein
VELEPAHGFGRFGQPTRRSRHHEPPEVTWWLDPLEPLAEPKEPEEPGELDGDWSWSLPDEPELLVESDDEPLPEPDVELLPEPPEVSPELDEELLAWPA